MHCRVCAWADDLPCGAASGEGSTMGWRQVLASSSRKHLGILAILALVASGLVSVAAVAIFSGHRAMVMWPVYHEMPEPAYRTAISVQFTSVVAPRAGFPASGKAGVPAAPFGQCPKIGADRGCGILIDVTGRHPLVVADHSQ